MIDLFCGLGGWAQGGLAAGYDVIGFDIERHVYGEHRYPAQLVVQDVLTLHGSQFRDAALIVASPPCQEYSYMAMPWSKAKAKAAEYRSGKRDVADLTRLFDACFRIQREASEAAGRRIPLVVENVRGAEAWVGRAAWNFGSYYPWGDVPALMPVAVASTKQDRKLVRPGAKHNVILPQVVNREGFKSAGLNWSDRSKRGQDFTRVAGRQAIDGRKVGGGADGWFGGNREHPLRTHHSKHPARKFASAMIAKIPFALSLHIAKAWYPLREAA